MSIDAVDQKRLNRGARWASYGFVTLLVLSVLWPAPVLWLNDATLHWHLTIDNDAFLGREAKSWDIVFWGIAGLFVLAMVHGRIALMTDSWRLFKADLSRVRDVLLEHRRTFPFKKALLTSIVASVFVVLMWTYLDARLVAIVEGFQDNVNQDVVRLLNRFGGGMNPPMVVLFFFLAGLVFRRARWIELAVCMTLSGGLAGILVQVIKNLVGRSRPELWLGPFHHTWPSATSFPSGHTVGAFALASVLIFGSRSWPIRIVSLLLAIGIAASRVLAFRHWPSDVVASALIGLAIGWFFVEPLIVAKIEPEPESVPGVE